MAEIVLNAVIRGQTASWGTLPRFARSSLHVDPTGTGSGCFLSLDAFFFSLPPPFLTPVHLFPALYFPRRAFNPLQTVSFRFSRAIFAQIQRYVILDSASLRNFQCVLNDTLESISSTLRLVSLF